MFINVDKAGKIERMTDSSEMQKLAYNQVPVTPNELAIIRICGGDLNYARNIIRDIEDRINKKLAALLDGGE